MGRLSPDETTMPLVHTVADLTDGSARPQPSVGLPVAMLDGIVFATGGLPGVAPDPAVTRLAERLSSRGLRTAAMVPFGRPVPDSPPAFTVVVETGRPLPDPAPLFRVADALEAHPARVAVLTTDPSTVEAACRGGFGLVVGLAAAGDASRDLARRGADVVIDSLEAVTLPAALSGGWPDAGQTRVPDGSWWLDYDGVDPAAEGVRETLCTLANGYMATRGAAPETSRGLTHYPGTYAAGVFNRGSARVRGHVHEVESLVNLPNWLPLRWRREGEAWVRPESAGIRDLRQSVDLRGGVLHRRYRHVDAAGRATTVISRRLVSMAQPHLAALQTTIIAENWSGVLCLRSAIDGRVSNTQAVEDRMLAHHHLVPDGQGSDSPDVLWLRMRTSQSRVTVGVA
ncbi:MAG: family 65 glycosyl hydrolase, partial [Betaproteobacteria bacterium]